MSHIIGTHILLECGWVPACIEGEAVDDTLSRIYGTFVDNYIHKCESKAALQNSGRPEIQRSAKRAKVKAGFMNSNRATLINALLEKNAPLKAHRIEYHLNWMYAESLQPQDVYSALFDEYIDQ
jgi:hypothetical protein